MEPCGARTRRDGYVTDGCVAVRITDDRLDRLGASLVQVIGSSSFKYPDKGARNKRVDHGVRAEEDPALLERLAAYQIPLTVCPLSNVNLGVFARLEEHNIARLLRRGIAVSLHSDDPPYFGGYLSHCFERTAAALELSAAEVVEMNKNAIRAAFLDREKKQRLLAASEAILRGTASEESEQRV